MGCQIISLRSLAGRPRQFGLVLLLWSALFGTANAQLDILITGLGDIRPVPIAVVPFGWEGEEAAAPFDLDGVIAADLNRSGRFRPIPDADMLQKPVASTDIVNIGASQNPQASIMAIEEETITDFLKATT